MRTHTDHTPAAQLPPAPLRRLDGIRPAVTKRGHQVAQQSAETRRALMGTIGRPFV